MQHLSKILFILMFIGGCGEVAEENGIETSQFGTAGSALNPSCWNGTAEAVCGAGIFTCLTACALTAVTGPEGPIVCAALCTGVNIPCASQILMCWNDWANPQSGGGSTGTGAGGTSPGTVTGCQEYDTTLPATAGIWIDTNIPATGATRVEVDVGGTPFYAAGATQDPNGASQSGGGWTDCAMGSPSTCQAGCGQFPFRAVMGKFGSGYPFVIGSHFEGAPTSSGNLYLTLNDCDFSDNSGAFSVHVSVCR